MNYRLSNLLIVFVLLYGFLSTSLSQTFSTEIKDLSRGAEVILTGKVKEQKANWNEDKTRIFTRVTIEVDEFVKGNRNSNSVVVTHPGGEVGEVGELYTHMPTFVNDEEVLLFLKKSKVENEYSVFDGENGKISLIKDEKTSEKRTTSGKKVSTLKKEIKNYVEKQ